MPTTTASYPIARLASPHARRSPRDLVMALEHGARHGDVLPDGDDERFVGYGVIGVRFASGHVLGLRRWPASSLGTAYTSVWHHTPDGEWYFHSDIASELACPRYAGAAARAADTTPIRLAWTDPWTLVVEVPEAAMRWTVSLRETIATRLFAAIRARVPDRWLASGRALAALAAGARVSLGTGPVRLVGRMPNGQRFRIIPRELWVIGASRAEIGGEDVGALATRGPAVALGDFQVPRRPLFAIATARFDAFDPERHLAITSRERLRPMPARRAAAST